MKHPFPPKSPPGTILGTRGIPSARVGSHGNLATDPTGKGTLYVKQNGVWKTVGQGQQRLYSSREPTPGASIVPGDPLTPPVTVDGVLYPSMSYALSVVYTPGTGAVLSWTWPFNTAGQSSVMPITGLFLQQSSISDNLPNNSGALYWVYVTTRDAPDPELDWTTIKQWGPTTHINSLPTTYTDATLPATDGYRAYRLILMLGPMALLGSTTPPGSHKWEIDWNSVVVVTPFTLTWTQNGTGSNLSWTAPKLAVAFITLERVSNLNRIHINWPSSVKPMSYRVFKTSNFFASDADYGLVAVTGIPNSPDVSGSALTWDDSDPSHTAVTYYRFRATLTDGSTVDSKNVGYTY